MDSLNLIYSQKFCMKNFSSDGKWRHVVFFTHNWQITEVWCEDILQPMDLTLPKYWFRKSFLGANWLCETHILVQESSEFLVERTREGRRCRREVRAAWSSEMGKVEHCLRSRDLASPALGLVEVTFPFRDSVYITIKWMNWKGGNSTDCTMQKTSLPLSSCLWAW